MANSRTGWKLRFISDLFLNLGREFVEINAIPLFLGSGLVKGRLAPLAAKQARAAHGRVRFCTTAHNLPTGASSPGHGRHVCTRWGCQALIYRHRHHQYHPSEPEHDYACQDTGGTEKLRTAIMAHRYASPVLEPGKTVLDTVARPGQHLVMFKRLLAVATPRNAGRNALRLACITPPIAFMASNALISTLAPLSSRR